MLSDRSDAIADLQRLLLEAPEDAAFLKSLLDDLRPLVEKAPLELIKLLPELNALRSGNVLDLVNTVSPGLLAYLATEP